jgi:hypothetical protein
MRISTTIKLQTYSCELVVTITDALKKESDKIYKKYKLKIDEEEEEGDNEGLLITSSIARYYLLIDTKYLTHNTLAHEMYHAVVRVTEDRGVSDEEAQAWLSGHLAGVIYKFLDKKKLEIKHGR